MYQSKYYTCEEIDERLLKGYYDDAVSKGYAGSLDQMKASLASENYLDLCVLFPEASFTYSEAVAKVEELVTNLTKGFKFSYVDPDYLEGVYLTLEYTGELWRCISDLTISKDDLDKIPSELEKVKNLVYNRFPSRWVVVDSKGANLGIIKLLTDDSYHVLTQVLTTRHGNGSKLDWSTHSDYKVYQYFRTYNISQYSEEHPQGVWDTWKGYKPSPVLLTQEEYEALSEKDPELTYLIYEDDEEEDE